MSLASPLDTVTSVWYNGAVTEVVTICDAIWGLIAFMHAAVVTRSLAGMIQAIQLTTLFVATLYGWV